MDIDTFTLAWLIGGGLLMAAETVIPGGVVVFLGIGAAMVGLLRLAGLLESWPHAVTAWFILSLGLLICLRGVVYRFFPGEKSVQPTDEDLAAYGSVVEVVDTVEPHEATGRIHFQGSSWPAISLGDTIPKGAKARISFRENLVWIVEPAYEALEEDNSGGIG